MKSIVFRGLPIGETTKEREPSVKTEFVSKFSFRGGKTQVDEKYRFKEGFRVVAFSSFLRVTVFDEAIDKGEVNGIEENFEGVIGWNKGRNFEIHKTQLSSNFSSSDLLVEYYILQ